MSAHRTKSGHTIEVERSLIDVTPLTIPDFSWRFTDPSSHEHRWRQTSVSPPAGDLPTVVRVVDAAGSDDHPAVWHYECLLCRTVIHPAYASNDQTYYVPGIWRCRIDGRVATKEEVEALLKEEKLL